MDDPTKDLFFVTISTQANRSKFINSCESFVARYGLDGIDIDMEYPAAMERGGPATDTPRLTAFFKEAKAGLSGKIVSVAAPASYWFLTGFEIDKVVNHVDYMNMMSYDFHGAWDNDVADEDATAKPHTSSVDIMDAISLYTRAKVDLSKVNLSMAWCWRTYAVGSCKGMGCKVYQRSLAGFTQLSGLSQFTTGGKAGKCTGEFSIKSQTEIWDEIKTGGIKPTYDSKSNTYWYNKDNDFVTYDDVNSWNHKTDIAGKYCFGGTFVW
ncbi:glycoside hydrolase superfamily [Pterulicium gracile]|uniref:Glycoside hydrolase superfamily n=1 Tax=Pterulicium gracile TaxID=1884261 RepID=A0A5C3Q639_9AGAR|nr:glycoside hydrolase superfamily [Pterula gracilis]